MAAYRQFLDSPGLQIDVDDTTPATTGGGDYLADFAGAIQAVADGAAEALRQLADDARPSRVTVGFGLTALGRGGFAIARGDDSASFRVTVRWDLEDQQAPERRAADGDRRNDG